MRDILGNLLPRDMVDLVLSQHFHNGNEDLPIKIVRERRAVVLHLDLKEYTALARKVSARDLAHHVNNIFRRFDLLVSEEWLQKEHPT